jgi:TetR/AcrR family transcriptional regulator, repressor for neighboring sulfatase
MSGPVRRVRVRRTAAEARRLILDTAQAQITGTAPQGLRLQDIAEAAGISHSLILHHFKSRAGLIRALSREAAAELRDRLLAAMSQPEYEIGDQLDEVFDAFRGGLAHRVAWLAVEDPEGADASTAMILRDIADVLHARRIAAAAPRGGNAIAREDTEWLIHLVAAAALGDAIYGAQLRRSAGIADDQEDGARRFRAWFAALLRAHGKRTDERERDCRDPQDQALAALSSRATRMS